MSSCDQIHDNIMIWGFLIIPCFIALFVLFVSLVSRAKRTSSMKKFSIRLEQSIKSKNVLNSDITGILLEQTYYRINLFDGNTIYEDYSSMYGNNYTSIEGPPNSVRWKLRKLAQLLIDKLGLEGYIYEEVSSTSAIDNSLRYVSSYENEKIITKAEKDYSTTYGVLIAPPYVINQKTGVNYKKRVRL